MSKFPQFLFLFALFFSITSALWPIPQKWTKGNDTLVVYPSLPIKLTPASKEKLSVKSLQAFTSAKNRLQNFLVQERYVSPNVKFDIPSKCKRLECVVVDVSTDCDLEINTDESYTLEISEESLTVKISSKTVYGAMHGLTTFSQLIYYDNDYLKHKKHRQLYLPFAPHKIVDAPAFEYRGLMLDTARNYYSVEDILKTLDIMSWNKFNVFHWHIVDATSWPVVSKVYPKLSEKGAYDPKTMIYTEQDISIIDEYAKLRGIQVIPEFDMPGHTHSIALGYPEIMSCVNEQPHWDLYSVEPPSGQLNPAIPETYKFLENLIPELASYFSSKYYHAGGDEVNTACWNQDATIKKYLSSNPNSSLNTLLAKFIDETHGIVRKSDKIPMAWQEMVVDFNLTLESDTLIQVWKDNVTAKQVADKGYKMIVGTSDYWYLDCGHGAWLGNDVNGNSWCDPYKTWQKVYSYNPTSGLTDKEAKLVIGGEVLLWSEQADPTNFERMLWPRSSAAAEVLWSGANDRNVVEALPRLHDWRFRMVKRGVQAEPLQPLWCVINGGCDLVLN